MRPYKDRVTASFALPEELYKRLLAEAERNFRTANNEAAFRLEQSFRRDDEAATPPNAA
jgi:TraY domain-containing protein